MATAAELARSQARRDLIASKRSVNFHKPSTNNPLVPPPIFLQTTQPTEEVPQQDISPPLPGGGQPLDCPLTSPVLHPVQVTSPNPSDDYNTENNAREKPEEKKVLRQR